MLQSKWTIYLHNTVKPIWNCTDSVSSTPILKLRTMSSILVTMLKLVSFCLENKSKLTRDFNCHFLNGHIENSVIIAIIISIPQFN